MGTVRQFELFHGAVLTALLRRDHPIALSMVETMPSDSWSTYRINDAVNLVVTHSATGTKQRRSNEVVWQFTLSPLQIKQIRDGAAYVALVCGAASIKSEMEVCLLDPAQIAKLIDVNLTQPQAVSVRASSSLKAYSGRHVKEITVAKNKYRKWEVPGL
jgi:hypothetical protein